MSKPFKKKNTSDKTSKLNNPTETIYGAYIKSSDSKDARKWLNTTLSESEVNYYRSLVSKKSS